MNRVETKSSQRSRGLALGVAILGVGALTLSGCMAPPEAQPKSGTPAHTLTLELGTLLPETGNIALLGQPQIAGVQLAVKDINDANLGITIDLTLGDSGDTSNKAFTTTVPNLINKKVSAIIGAAASDVTAVVIDQVVGADTILFSPANSAAQFSTWDDHGLYWRTASTNELRGEVLGNLIAADGADTLGTLVLNGAYGTGLQKTITEAFEAAGGTVVAEQTFNTGDTTFDAQISSVLAQNPDAIQLVSEDEASTIIPALKDAGFDMSKLYLADGNTVQYGDKFAPGTLTGAKGILPGPVVTEDFQQRLKDLWADVNNGAELTNFGFAAESYDAVVLIALAALSADSTEADAIASKLKEVSGGSGNGKKATNFKQAAKIINAGGVADYDGFSGGIKFDDNGDASEASIGVYQYDATNNYKRIND